MHDATKPVTEKVRLQYNLFSN